MLGLDMFLKFILIFCVIPKEYGVIQNVASIPYKHNRNIQTYKRVNLDKYHENRKTILENHFKERPSDLSSESRRIFNWIKKILHENNTKVTPKVPTHEEVLDEKTQFRLIEKNLTETLTKLSHVLTQILNIVKYAKYQYFDDIHEFLPTNIGKNTLLKRNMGRYKRGLDLIIAPISRDEKPTEDKLNNKHYGMNDIKEETNIKICINKADNVFHDDNVTNNENRTKLNLNVLSRSENKQINIAKFDLSKSNNIEHVKKENYGDSKTSVNTKSKIIDGNNDSNVLKVDVVTKPLANDSNILTTNMSNIDSIKNITKRDVNQAKLESIDSDFQDKSRIKRDIKVTSNEVGNSTEKTEVATNSEVKKEKTSTKAKDLEDIENAGTTKAYFITKSGRRFIQTKPEVSDEIKSRLFKYIDEAFNDIMKKIDSLKQTKDLFSKDANYQVGYIISNIDTLDVNMRNMRMEMIRNKYIWDDNKILNLFDTVKVSNQAVSDLLEVLKMYLEKSFN